MENKVSFQLYSTFIETKGRTLVARWSSELEQKLTHYYGSKSLQRECRCIENANRVKKLRRKRYWWNQAVKWSKRTD